MKEISESIQEEIAVGKIEQEDTSDDVLSTMLDIVNNENSKPENEKDEKDEKVSEMKYYFCSVHYARNLMAQLDMNSEEGKRIFREMMAFYYKMAGKPEDEIKLALENFLSSLKETCKSENSKKFFVYYRKCYIDHSIWTVARVYQSGNVKKFNLSTNPAESKFSQLTRVLNTLKNKQFSSFQINSFNL